VQELLIAKRDLELSRVIKRLSNCDALIIDDIGYVQQKPPCTRSSDTLE